VVKTLIQSALARDESNYNTRLDRGNTTTKASKVRIQVEPREPEREVRNISVVTTGGDELLCGDLINRYALTPVRRDDTATIDALYNSSQHDTILFERYRVPAIKWLFQCLTPGEWINDEMISLVQERLKEEFPQNAYIHCTFMTRLLINGTNNPTLNPDNYDYSQVSRWMHRNIFTCDKLFFPINPDRTHWILVVIDINSRKVQLYDSIHNADRRTKIHSVFKRWLADEGAKHNVQATWNFVYSDLSTNPQQVGGVDCGVYTIMFMHLISHGRSVHTMCQADVIPLRKYLFYSILLNGYNHTIVRDIADDDGGILEIWE
jgi:sentrin-specific protease 1